MDILQATEKFLLDICDETRRQASIDRFDGIILAGEHITEEDVKEMSLFLLAALQKETTQDIKDAIFWPLAIAATYYNVTSYIDWDAIIKQLPLLSEAGLKRALDVLYSSTRHDDIIDLKKYLSYPNLIVRMMVLDVICQIRWNRSDGNREVEASIRSKNYQYLQTVINTPERYILSQIEMEEQFEKLCNKVLEIIQGCFEKQT